jgi:hypothetical protein
MEHVAKRGEGYASIGASPPASWRSRSSLLYRSDERQPRIFGQMALA